MFRLLLFFALGYCAYRMARELIDSVPDDFDIVGPPVSVPARRRSLENEVRFGRRY